MKIEGFYPHARYFSFVAYNGDANGRPHNTAGHLYDGMITPDGGGVNPFDQSATSTLPVNGAANGYTVYIRRNDTTDTNTIKVELTRSAGLMGTHSEGPMEWR